MNSQNQFCIKIIHCGDRSFSNPGGHGETSYFYMPMGIFSLADVLDNKGFDVEIIHLDLEMELNINRTLDFTSLDAVGLDLHWVNQSINVFDTIKSIKKVKPGVFIFLGGYTASFYSKEILQDYPGVDAVIRGDGETPVVELCRALHRHILNQRHPGDYYPPSLADVPNLAWRKKTNGSPGEIIFNPLSYVSSQEEMNEFDFTRLDLLRNREMYREFSRFWATFPEINSWPVFFLEIGRGCVYNCSICGGNAAAQIRLNNRKSYVVRSIDAVISSIKKAVSFGYSMFLSSFTFENSDEWYIQLFKRIKRENLAIRFSYESWGLISKALVDEISQACEAAIITISPDTAHPGLRKKNKDPRLFYTNTQLEEILQHIAGKPNLKAQVYFGYYYPFDTEKTVFQTMDYITKLNRRYAGTVEMVYMNNNTDPGSALFLHPDKHQMDIDVCTLNDYMVKLKESYMGRDGSRPGRVLLSKPVNMSLQDAVNLADKIDLFNQQQERFIGTAGNSLSVKLIHCGNRNITNPRDQAEKNIFFFPMGLIPMASELKKQGFDVEIINLDLESGGIEDIVDLRRLDAVGLDLFWVNQALVVLNTAALIKKIKPGIFIFLGGYTASFFAREILEKYPYIDAVVRGEGEVPIVELCKALAAPRDNSLASVPNLAWRDRDQGIVSNDFSYTAGVEQMDRLNFTDVQLLRNWETYRDLCKFWTKFTCISRHSIFFLEIGRGCKYNCLFCGANALAQEHLNNRRSYTVRSVAAVLSSVREALSYGYTAIMTSFEFEGSDAWYGELFRKIREEKLQLSICYGSWGLPSRASIDSLAQTFADVLVEISPESADLEIRKANKDHRLFYTNRELEQCLEYIGTKPNVKAQVYFSYFLAYDTRETVFDTMAFIAKLLLHYTGFTEVVYLNLSTDPASLLYLYPEKYDISISVRNFSDYVKKIEENYIEKKGSQLDLTLLRPRSIMPVELFDLTRRINIFKKLFLLFETSTVMISKAANSPAVIVDYLRDLDLSTVVLEEESLSLTDLKNFLDRVCQQEGLHGSEIEQAVESDFQRASLQPVVSKQVNYYHGAVIDAISTEEKNKISTNIKNSREKISADFDF